MDKYINNFLDDDEKMLDFFSLSKEEFLTAYSYVPEEEYTEEILAAQQKAVERNSAIIKR